MDCSSKATARGGGIRREPARCGRTGSGTCIVGTHRIFACAISFVVDESWICLRCRVVLVQVATRDEGYGRCVCVGVRCGRHVCGPAPGQAVAGRVGCVGYSVPCTVGACLPRCLRAFPPARPPRHTPPPEYSVRSARVLGTALSIVSLPFSPRATRRHASELCLALDSASHMAHAPCDARPHMHSTFTCTRLSSSTGRD
jgi:hypothetical protein